MWQVGSDDYLVSEPNSCWTQLDQLACESITCPVGSTICMFNKKSTDNLQNIAISVSCLTSNGKFFEIENYFHWLFIHLTNKIYRHSTAELRYDDTESSAPKTNRCNVLHHPWSELVQGTSTGIREGCDRSDQKIAGQFAIARTSLSRFARSISRPVGIWRLPISTRASHYDYEFVSFAIRKFFIQQFHE